MTPNQNDPKESLGVLGRIIDTSKVVDNLAMSALLGTMGGSFVLGCNAGGIFWMPFGIVAPIAVYRILVELRKSREELRKTDPTQIDSVTQVLVESLEPDLLNGVLVGLLKSDLSDSAKTVLIKGVISSLEQQPIGRKRLGEYKAGSKIDPPKEADDLGST